MDLRQISHFIAIADAESFLGAAKTLNISQPALSKSIHVLEKSLDAKLFERRARGVSMTIFGRTLYNYGRTVLSEVERATREIRTLKTSPSGLVTIGCLRTGAHVLLPEVITRFLARTPGVRIRIVEGLNTELLNNLVQGNYDFMIGVADRNISADEFSYEPLFYDRLTIAARRGHPLGRKRRVTQSDLKTYPWILPSEGTQRRKHFDDMFYAEGIAPPLSSIESGSFQFTRSILAQSDHLALISENSINVERDHGILTTLALDSEFLMRPVSLIFKRSRALTPASLSIIREIKNLCKERAPSPPLPPSYANKDHRISRKG